MVPARAIVLAGFVGGLGVVVSAQQAKLGDAISRMSAYLKQYEERLAPVVAEEQYLQAVDIVDPSAPAGWVTIDRDSPALPIGHLNRQLRSDYALTRAADKNAWVGYRDTFEVDGKPIRDREDRLIRLLTGGTTAAAARIAEESSRFNLANTLVTRNINVPTLVLEMIHPRNQWRFGFRKSGEDILSGTRTWRLDFKERQRPTFIRNSNGRDRPTYGSIWVDPITGEVWKTMLTWQSDPRGTIAVIYGHVPNIDPLVPLTMTERYYAQNSTITGDASYSKYRQFQTDARLIANPDSR
jgi:hypothetical protein